ncbi:hypothetical protein [uncultured Brevundimonas sp.]|uniref:hypothetical protein n=1 Tax=uncultured Brevundimonas sp. TaxID=213418 RepID=UPI002624DBD1|nr:hypothetical protein [uncultured Brevundimonas sp.]
MSLKSWFKAERLERVEIAYLHALRVGGLLIATLCLIAALFFAGNAAWRLFINTEVAPDATSVDTAQLAQLVASPPASGSDSSASSTDPIKAAHDKFKKDFWPKYYAIYERAYQQNRNTADSKVSSDDMLAVLGYDFDTYKASQASDSYGALVVDRMVEDANYQATALKHVGEIMAAAPVQARLNSYKVATKSEQRCTTTPRTQRVNQVCGYYYVYDCSYTRTVQDRRCEAVFPESVMTPAAAFERADATFADAWLADEGAKAATAADETSRRQAQRAQIGPNLQLALIIIGGFFTVMFFFLLVAIERHLRARKAAAVVAPAES